MKILDRAEWAAFQAWNTALLKSRRGGLAGYGIAWLLGVPLSVLIIIYLVRRH